MPHVNRDLLSLAGDYVRTVPFCHAGVVIMVMTMMYALTTDFMHKVDGIPGVVGVGPRTAVRLLKNFGNLEGIFENIDDIGKSVFALSCIQLGSFIDIDPRSSLWSLSKTASLPFRGAKTLKSKLLAQEKEVFLYRDVVTLYDNLDLNDLKGLTVSDLRYVGKVFGGPGLRKSKHVCK